MSDSELAGLMARLVRACSMSHNRDLIALARRKAREEREEKRRERQQKRHNERKDRLSGELLPSDSKDSVEPDHDDSVCSSK